MCIHPRSQLAQSLAHRTFLMRCLHAAVRPERTGHAIRIAVTVFRALSCGELTHRRDLPLPYGRVQDALEGLLAAAIGCVLRDVPLACRGFVLEQGGSPECGMCTTNKQRNWT